MLASPWGSGGRLKIAPDIADQHLTPLLDDTFDLLTAALSKATNSSFLPPSVDVLTKLDDLFAVAPWAKGRHGGGATELSTVHGGQLPFASTRCPRRNAFISASAAPRFLIGRTKSFSCIQLAGGSVFRKFCDRCAGLLPLHTRSRQSITRLRSASAGTAPVVPPSASLLRTAPPHRSPSWLTWGEDNPEADEVEPEVRGVAVAVRRPAAPGIEPVEPDDPTAAAENAVRARRRPLRVNGNPAGKPVYQTGFFPLDPRRGRER
jgi:hypothetical protein